MTEPPNKHADADAVVRALGECPECGHPVAAHTYRPMSLDEAKKWTDTCAVREDGGWCQCSRKYPRE